MSSRHVALLRGVNVGGKNKLPMKDLAAMFVDAGCSNVLTFIQSGNVVFEAPPRVASGISIGITTRIEEAFGYRVPVVLRTADELRDVVAINPFLGVGSDENTLHVMFLADLPEPRAVESLDPGRSPPDEFRALGREIYLRLPNGVAESKLTNAYFDAKLRTVGTSRNWRTVLKLLAMIEA